MAVSGAESPSQIHIAIEVPHGPVVETLLERGFHVHAINPKQFDWFRDRYTLAGAKGDSRDALVMASALRTDPRCFRKLEAADPAVIALREWSCNTDDLSAERNRLPTACASSSGAILPAVLELDTEPWCRMVPGFVGEVAFAHQGAPRPRNNHSQTPEASSHPPLRRRPCAQGPAPARRHRACRDGRGRGPSHRHAPSCVSAPLVAPLRQVSDQTHAFSA